MSFNNTTDADRSLPDATENDANNEIQPNDLSDDADIKPYAVANMSDHEAYLRTAASRAPQTGGMNDIDIEPYAVANMSDHKAYLRTAASRAPQTGGMNDIDIEPYAVANMSDHEAYLRTAASRAPQTGGMNDIDIEPYAVANMSDHEAYLRTATLKTGSDPKLQEPQDPCNKQFPNPTFGTDVRQQDSHDSREDTGSGVHNLQGPLNPDDLRPNPMYRGANCYQPDRDAQDNITFGGSTDRYGKGPCIFTTVGGLAVSSTNKIFVTDEDNKRIQAFNMEGVLLRSLPTGNMSPQKIATGRNDSLWVTLYAGNGASRFDNFIYQMSQEGQVLAKCKFEGRLLILGLAVDKLSDKIILTINYRFEIVNVWFSPTRGKPPQRMPTCQVTRFPPMQERFSKTTVAVDKRGNIFILESWHHALKFDKNGDYLCSFGGFGTGAGNLKLYDPSGICVDSLGRIIVADNGNNRVEMFTADGTHISTVAQTTWRPEHVATGGEGQLVVADEKRWIHIFPKY
ncbi:TRIM3 [Branchiostoma lanceolatum]|uniref:TRIM3 protein n=1 Tax=Branchiostoma lanceolatum TaxID=7740 RepID=A0A8J9Z8Y0_BRALA|nr:TRIM3 [Branchiostoma lanceolatum]